MHAPRAWVWPPSAMCLSAARAQLAHPWPTWLLPVPVPVLERVRAAARERFDQALLNFYEDGEGALGWHSDKA